MIIWLKPGFEMSGNTVTKVRLLGLSALIPIVVSIVCAVRSRRAALSKICLALNLVLGIMVIMNGVMFLFIAKV